MAVDPITWALIAAGAASAIGAGAQSQTAKAQAEAMMPEGWKGYLEQLESGDLGMTAAQRAQLESDHSMMRAGALADAQARQLQMAAAGTGTGGMNARDLFLQEMATQEAQNRMLNEQTRMTKQTDMQVEAANRAMMMELQQRQASMEAAKKAARWNLVAGIAGAGATAAGGYFSAEQQKKMNDQWLTEQAKNREAMVMAGVYGYQANPYQYQTNPYQGLV